MMRVLATGWWCRKCEFFEVEDEINETVETCVSCGCNGSEHTPVEIVTKGWGQ